MAKGNKTASVVTKGASEEIAALAAANPEVAAQKPVKVLAVKPGQKYRGARQAWYETLCQYDGKPLADFVAHVTANRPSQYGARSKHAGTPEPVQGWVRFFVRTGVASEVDAK